MSPPPTHTHPSFSEHLCLRSCVKPVRCPTPQPGLHSLLSPSGSQVINKTPQTLANPLKQNCPRRQMVDLISFPLNGLNPFQLIRRRKQRTAGQFLGRR